ncbi:hypothetical protein A3F29_01765 [Candidatus Roizmanbacteria bacterium RIFCSPHIGHO2_12_FULL_33_9]|uniref:Small-conductance mechanosensitive ion channel n=1 Tax=Candidatus Roizmanbacteria bacterium RIFCSPHIGHO2_12_FULL_33_9 TaxID=1802045 RepID=A0A1F7HJE0_9BACT|nr:MAG: hypothetical protein A3F29_01765 [Candidatus Roizmanbacteria bacterium RIFCSPHIGHO2_12_FULL_33_9]
MLIDTVNSILQPFWKSFVGFLPDLFGGLLILIIGLIVANLLKGILLSVFGFLKFEKVFQQAKGVDKGEIRLWEEIIAEIVRWTVVILFLIPTLQVWGLTEATTVLNEILFYIPNVIIAVVIGFVGLVASNLVANLVRRTVKTLGSTTANTLAVFTKSVIVFFTVLVVLSQLGVAQDIVRILFTGIIGMLALAGGLAFGLGGKEIARDLLADLTKKIK